MTRPNSYYVYPYKQSSRSARALADALGGRVLRREDSVFVPRPWKKVINWGSTSCPWPGHLNRDGQVNASCDKLSFFQYALSSESPGIELPRFPRWSESLSEAVSWGTPVVARTVLNGHSGVGIVYKDRDHLDELPDAPLYVEYIPKDAEYRVHVFNGEVIDVQRKIKDPSREVTDWKVRSHHNGFIYVRRNADGESYRDICPGDVLEQSKRALACSGLVFAGCDVIWNEKRQKAYILELNTAVGLEGETVNVYAAAIRKYYES